LPVVNMQTSAMRSAGNRLQARPCTTYRWTAAKSIRRNVKRAAEWDPEGILPPPQDGLIARRMLQKQMKDNKELAALVSQTQDVAEQQAMARRASRTPPDDDEELVEFFLNTMADDMEFEVARCRPKLGETFFKHLDKVVGKERFAPMPDEDRVAELEALRDYLTAATAVIDKTIQETASAVDRMKKLLSSKDKKATILQMAEVNEIDKALIDLLRQNAAAARMAEQEEAAKFIEKVMTAAAKYVVTIEPEKMANPMDLPKSAVELPRNLGKRASGGSGLIL
jgi:hypothetical protein